MWSGGLCYLFAKGKERGKGEFEMLHPPWDANNRATEDKSEGEMRTGRKMKGAQPKMVF